jgi:hypothetical protein
MSLKSSFSQMTEKLDRMRAEFLMLKAGVDDQPEGTAFALQDAFADALEDIIAFINGATDAAHQANLSLTDGIDMSVVLEKLTRCNENWNHVSFRYWSALNSYEKLNVLMELGRSRGGEWQVWTRSIEGGLNKCSAPMLDLNQAIFECWREIGDAVLVAASLGQPPRVKR